MKIDSMYKIKKYINNQQNETYESALNVKYRCMTFVDTFLCTRHIILSQLNLKDL